jgi:hypothetical protein
MARLVDATARTQELVELRLVYPENTETSVRWTRDTTPSLAPSVLKSMLQKNVRLSRPEAAVRVALTLIRLDFLQVRSGQPMLFCGAT